MTTKEKYELFDKTKINEKVLGILKNMQESSKNFTDESVNSKIDSALDKLIENFRANKPEALLTLPEAKKEVKKEKEKATKENEGKDLSDKKDTDDKTGLPKISRNSSKMVAVGNWAQAMNTAWQPSSSVFSTISLTCSALMRPKASTSLAKKLLKRRTRMPPSAKKALSWVFTASK